MQTTDLLFIALGTWYLSYCISKKDGPFNIFAHVRTFLPLGGLTACIVCLSVWIAALLYLLALVTMPLVQIVGMAGAAILLHRFTGGDLV